VIGVLGARARRPGPPVVTTTDITPVTSEPGFEFQPAISPDGKVVAFLAGPVALPRLVIRSTNVGGGEIRLSDTVLGTQWYPSWSADGELVRFLSCRGTCAWREAGRLGGAVRAVTLPADATGPAWSPDGARVAFVTGDTIFTSSTGDTGMRRVARPAVVSTGLHSLAWSPDGRRIAYVSGNPVWRTIGNVAASSIWIVSADGGEPQPVATENCLNVSPAWLDVGHLLFVSNRDGPRAVYVVEVGKRGARGAPRAVPGILDPHSISYATGARTLAYARLALRQNVWAYPLGRRKPLSIQDGSPVTTGSQVIEEHDVSPDGKWLAYDSPFRGNMDLFKVPLGGGQAVPVTATPVDEFRPRWSPDGREIAFYYSGSGEHDAIKVVSAEGGTPVTLTDSHKLDEFPTWSPDGLDVAFLSSRTGRWEAWLLSRDSVGGAWHEAVQLTDSGCIPLDWAPDGSGVLCGWGQELLVVSRQGRVVWRRDLAATAGLSRETWVGPSYAPFMPARYSRDGRTIYTAGVHRDGRQGVWAIPVLGGGTPRLMIAYDDAALASPGFLSVGPDQLYLTVSQYESDIWVMKLKY
jgi:Tol biopolymer transport system component